MAAIMCKNARISSRVICCVVSGYIGSLNCVIVQFVGLQPPQNLTISDFLHSC